MLDPRLYEITREGERWVCRPSTLFVRFGFFMGAGMSAFLVYLAWSIWRKGPSDEAGWFGAAIFLMAVLVAALATWRWRTGRTPLTVERSGRVCYGEKELCSAAQVRYVRLALSPGGEGAYDVCLDLGGSRLVVPGYAYGSRENALAFAQELAGELRVPVEAAGESPTIAPAIEG
jgi:hypothetical protein